MMTVATGSATFVFAYVNAIFISIAAIVVSHPFTILPVISIVSISHNVIAVGIISRMRRRLSGGLLRWAFGRPLRRFSSWLRGRFPCWFVCWVTCLAFATTLATFFPTYMPTVLIFVAATVLLYPTAVLPKVPIVAEVFIIVTAIVMGRTRWLSCGHG